MTSSTATATWGCIYLVDAYGRWFWGSNFQMTGTKSYGFATSLDAAKTAFKAQYLAWKSGSDARLTEAKKLAGHRRPRASA